MPVNCDKNGEFDDSEGGGQPIDNLSIVFETEVKGCFTK